MTAPDAATRRRHTTAARLAALAAICDAAAILAGAAAASACITTRRQRRPAERPPDFEGPCCVRLGRPPSRTTITGGYLSQAAAAMRDAAAIASADAATLAMAANALGRAWADGRTRTLAHMAAAAGALEGHAAAHLADASAVAGDAVAWHAARAHAAGLAADAIEAARAALEWDSWPAASMAALAGLARTARALADAADRVAGGETAIVRAILASYETRRAAPAMRDAARAVLAAPSPYAIADSMNAAAADLERADRAAGGGRRTRASAALADAAAAMDAMTAAGFAAAARDAGADGMAWHSGRAHGAALVATMARAAIAALEGDA